MKKIKAHLNSVHRETAAEKPLYSKKMLQLSIKSQLKPEYQILKLNHYGIPTFIFK